MAQYFETNVFLTSINNEIAVIRNNTYSENFKSLNKLVLVIFSADETVVPKESSWFGSYAPPKESSWSLFPGRILEKTIIPMRLQPLYREDRIGLRALDKRGDVVLETCEGVHMELVRECWDPIIKKYVGSLVQGQRTIEAQSVLKVQ